MDGRFRADVVAIIWSYHAIASSSLEILRTTALSVKQSFQELEVYGSFDLQSTIGSAAVRRLKHKRVNHKAGPVLERDLSLLDDV